MGGRSLGSHFDIEVMCRDVGPLGRVGAHATHASDHGNARRGASSGPPGRGMVT